MLVIAEEINEGKLAKYLGNNAIGTGDIRRDISDFYEGSSNVVKGATLERFTECYHLLSRGHNVQIDGCSFANVSGYIGNNVILIGCSFADTEVYIPDNSILIRVHTTNSTLKIRSEKCVISNSTLIDSICRIEAKECVLSGSKLRKTTLHILGRYLLIDRVDISSDADMDSCSILQITTRDKDIYLGVVDVCIKGNNVINNPKLLVEPTTRRCYYRQTQIFDRWQIAEDSITIINGILKTRIKNQGVLRYSNRLSGLKLVSVGKGSRLDLSDNRLYWYATQALEELVVGDNVVASLHNLKKTTTKVYVKDNFVGYIDKNTGTTKGGIKVVREVHGERSRC